MVAAKNLEIHLLDPKDRPLTRLFRHPRMEWDPPPAIYRNLRVDPPTGAKDQYAILYTADTLPCVAAECRILRCDYEDNFTYSADLAKEYKVVRFSFNDPAIFIPIDGRNCEILGLHPSKISFATYEPYQNVAAELYARFGRVTHGLSWQSFHRNQSGRVFAIWHEHKATIGLQITSATPYTNLEQDSEWIDFLGKNPNIKEVNTPS